MRPITEGAVVSAVGEDALIASIHSQLSESLQMSANCGDYGERRGVGICNEFPIAFMPRMLWLCASAVQAEHPRGLETDKSEMGIGHGFLDGQLF